MGQGRHTLRGRVLGQLTQKQLTQTYNKPLSNYYRGRPKVRNYASICETVTLNATEQHIGNLNKFGSAYDGPRFSPNLLQFCPPSCENWPGQNCSPKNGP